VMVTKSVIIWDITPCSPLSVNRRFGRTYRLHLQGRRNKRASRWEASEEHIACHLLASLFLAELISSALKKGVICFSETSVDTHRTILRYIPEDGTF
jgi:hypothetical protein